MFNSVSTYDKFRQKQIAIFGRVDFKGAFFATQRSALVSLEPNWRLRIRRGQPISACTRMPVFQPKRSCCLPLIILFLNSQIRRRESIYHKSGLSAHLNGSTLGKSCQQELQHVF